MKVTNFNMLAILSIGLFGSTELNHILLIFFSTDVALSFNLGSSQWLANAFAFCSCILLICIGLNFRRPQHLCDGQHVMQFADQLGIRAWRTCWRRSLKDLRAELDRKRAELNELQASRPTRGRLRCLSKSKSRDKGCRARISVEDSAEQARV